MFDVASAVVLGLVLTGLVSLVRTVVQGPPADRLKVIICVAVSVVTVLLVAASDFAGDQVVLDRPLDSLNFWSQMVVALLLAGLASVSWQTLRAVKNIGANNP